MNFDALIQSAPEVAIPALPELPSGDPRESFRILLDFLKVGLSMAPIEEAWQERRVAVFKPAYKAKFKSRKFNQIKALTEFPEIADHFDVEGKQLVEAYVARKREVEDLLVELAEQITPTPGDTWHKARTVNSTSYNTQGYGAHMYARRSAESEVPDFAASGLEAEVRVEQWDDRPDYKPLYGKRSGIADYVVWVKADPLDIEITRRRPGMGLKDWLQWMWDRGCNPRVLNPYLPHGLEQELGVSVGGWTP